MNLLVWLQVVQPRYSRPHFRRNRQCRY